MAIVKKSFISNLVGRDSYQSFKAYSIPIVIIGTCVLLFLYIIAHYVHSIVISYLLNLTNGFSLLFIAYIVALITVLDIEVEMEENETMPWQKPIKDPKPFRYKLTIIWAIVMVVMGVAALFYTNKYREQYAFECETFLVDNKSGIYHLDWDYIECETANSADKLEPMKGYKINKSYSFCKECQDWLYDAEDEQREAHLRPD